MTAARRWLSRTLALAVVLLAGVSVLGFGGRLWWVFDGFSHFRVQYLTALLACTLLLAVLRRWRWAAAAAAFAAVNAALVVPLYFGGRPADVPEGKRLRVVVLNVLSSNREYGRVRRFVRDAEPDVVVFIEVDAEWERQLRPLRDVLPHDRVRTQAGNFGMAVYSRLPFAGFEFHEIEPGCPAAVAQFGVEGGTLTLVGAHPAPPVGREMTRRRDRQLRRLAGLVNGQNRPLLLVGDLNTTSWSPAFAEFAKATGLRDSRQGFGVQPTWPSRNPLLRVPIDHALVSGGLIVSARRVGPHVGSDHRPVVLDVVPSRPAD